MPSISNGLFWVAALSMCVAYSLAAMGSPSSGVMSTDVKEIKSQLSICMDDSDCQKLGQGIKYACFKYLCYPWKDDSEVDDSEKRKTCRKFRDCKDVNGKEMSCYKHQDRRRITVGLCFDDKVTHQCDNKSDCSEGYGCCGGFCCEQHYYNKYTDLPCTSDFGCQDYGLGKFCCETSKMANETEKVCCNEDPNAPASTQSFDNNNSSGGSINVLRVPIVAAIAAAIIIKHRL